MFPKLYTNWLLWCVASVSWILLLTWDFLHIVIGSVSSIVFQSWALQSPVFQPSITQSLTQPRERKKLFLQKNLNFVQTTLSHLCLWLPLYDGHLWWKIYGGICPSYSATITIWLTWFVIISLSETIKLRSYINIIDLRRQLGSVFSWIVWIKYSQIKNIVANINSFQFNQFSKYWWLFIKLGLRRQAILILKMIKKMMCSRRWRIFLQKMTPSGSFWQWRCRPTMWCDDEGKSCQIGSKDSGSLLGGGHWATLNWAEPRLKLLT